MAKNKNKNASAAAESSQRNETDNLKALVKQVAQSRKEVDRLRFELSSLSASISLFKSKNKNVSATAIAGNKEIEKLKILNNQLVRDVAESRKQSDRLRLELASLAADQDILAAIERDVFRLVLSSSLDEAAACSNADMAAVMKKTDSAVAELAREKDAIRKYMNRLLEERDSSLHSLEQVRKVADSTESGGRRIWKKWIYPATASFCVAAAVTFCAFKGFNLKN